MNSGTDKRLLLVEDDSIARGLIRSILLERGYEIIEAKDGESACEILSGDVNFGSVLMDLGLPDCDGLDLVAEFRGNSALARVPFILETARNDAEVIREGVAAGAFYFLTKPLNRERLSAVVDAAVAWGRTLRDSASLQGTDCSSGFDRGGFSLRTLAQARQLAATLAPMCPLPEAAALVLQELLINAIEHGNLCIDYPTKTQLMLENTWLDEVERRSLDESLGARQVAVDFLRSEQGVSITITDQGEGFDWMPYLELSEERAFDPNGRGIAIVAASVDALEFNAKGNSVTVRWYDQS